MEGDFRAYYVMSCSGGSRQGANPGKRFGKVLPRSIFKFFEKFYTIPPIDATGGGYTTFSLRMHDAVAAAVAAAVAGEADAPNGIGIGIIRVYYGVTQC